MYLCVYICMHLSLHVDHSVLSLVSLPLLRVSLLLFCVSIHIIHTCIHTLIYVFVYVVCCVSLEREKLGLVSAVVCLYIYDI